MRISNRRGRGPGLFAIVAGLVLVACTSAPAPVQTLAPTARPTPTVAPTRLPGIAHALDWAYSTFAKHRLRLTGRCLDGSCPLPHPATATGA